MNKVIYKYELIPDRSGHCRVEVPYSATLLTVDSQGEGIFLWVETTAVNVEALRTLHFWVIPTGVPFQGFTDTIYMKTVFMDNGFVFHIYAPHKEYINV